MKLFFPLFISLVTSTNIMARVKTSEVTAAEDEKRLKSPHEMLEVVFRALKEGIENTDVGSLARIS